MQLAKESAWHHEHASVDGRDITVTWTGRHVTQVSSHTSEEVPTISLFILLLRAARTRCIS